MQKLLASLATGASFVIVSSAALADGSYDRAGAYERPFTWSGIYVGGQVGGDWASWDWLSNRTGVGFCAANPFRVPCDPVDQSASSFVGGGQIGARWQTGHWVLGVESSFAYSRLQDTTPSESTNALTNHTELRNIVMATAQLGYAWDRTLWYVKGGYAGSDLTRNVSVVPSEHFVLESPASQWANGWSIGTGIEYAFHAGLSIGVEYDFTNLRAGDVSTCASGGLSIFCGSIVGTLPVRYSDFNADVQQVVVRLNYKFGSRDEYQPLK